MSIFRADRMYYLSNIYLKSDTPISDLSLETIVINGYILETFKKEFGSRLSNNRQVINNF